MEINKIYCENCLDTIARMPDNFVDLLFTSPPYFAGKEYEDRYKTPEGYSKYINFLKNVFSKSYRIIKPGGHLWINIDDSHTSLKSIYKKSIVLPTHATLITYLSETFDYKEMILWKKIRGRHATGGSRRLLGSYGRFGSPGSIPILQECEYILWFKKPGKRQITDKQRKQSSLTPEEFKQFGMQIWVINPERSRQHPAPFPIEIPYRVIKLSTFVGDIVYDPFIGSGTTAIVSHDLGRNWLGSEISKEYCEIAEQRINENLF